MTSTEKATVRRTVQVHPRSGRRVVVTTIGHTLFLRLERSTVNCPLDLFRLYDLAEREHAAAQSGANINPCKDPMKARNV